PSLPRTLRRLARNLAQTAQHRPQDRRGDAPLLVLRRAEDAQVFRSPAGRSRLLDQVQGQGCRQARAGGGGDRDPHVLGVRGHDPGFACDRRHRRHARGVANRSRALDPVDRHDIDARIRVGRGAHHRLRHLARLAQRFGGRRDRGASDLLSLRLAGRDGGDPGHGLCRAHDPRLDDRGDERAIYPHRAPEGPRLSRDRAQTRAAQRADRAVHRDHAPLPVAPDRRGDRRGDVPLPGLRPDPGRRRRQQRHRPSARLLARIGGRGALDATHLRHWLRLAQSAHPRALKGARLQFLSPAEIVLKVLVQLIPVWASLALVLGLSLIFRKRLGLFGHVVASGVGFAGLFLVGFWLFAAIFDKHIELFDPLGQIAELQFAPPGAIDPHSGLPYLFGGDKLARDMFGRVIAGARIVLIIAPLATLLALSAGVLLGLPAGYFGGRVDAALSFLTNLVLAFPIIVLFYLLVSPGILETPIPYVLAAVFFAFPIVLLSVAFVARYRARPG